MALRLLTYTCLTYEELIRRGGVKPGNKLPPLLPALDASVPRTGVRRVASALSSRVASAAEAWQIPTRTWRE